MTAAFPARAEDGAFLPGVSGNPAGRPPSDRNKLAHIKRKLEIAVREGMSAERLSKIVAKMADMAEKGDHKAAKVIFDAFISKADASVDQAEESKGTGITIRIENATFKAQSDVPVLEAVVTEVKEITNG